jgi:hypothetical protein
MTLMWELVGCATLVRRASWIVATSLLLLTIDQALEWDSYLDRSSARRLETWSI